MPVANISYPIHYSQGSHVIDHFRFEDKIDHSTVYTSNQESDADSFGVEQKLPILYKGVGLSHSNYENFQVFGILKGENSTVSYNEKNKEVISIGQKILLVAAVQVTGGEGEKCGNVNVAPRKKVIRACFRINSR